MALTTNATVSTTKEIRLEPSLRRKLLLRLKTWQSLDQQIKALELAKKKLSTEIGGLRDETGELSVELEGFTVTLVAPVRKVLNERKLISLGCAAAWIQEATDNVPSRSYNKITPPRAAGAEEDE